ncbi:MAG: SNF2 helicase associated domain-containing protein [Blautia sp.]|nr:SNF2 helicase associated domain-containing protein [Blautia sp.]
MEWSYLFSQNILSRGRQYFIKGRVTNLQQEGAKYTAEVIGTKPYYVEAAFASGKRPSLSCDCPYAQDGKRCKHMAALLFAVAEKFAPSQTDSGSKLSINRQIHPFVKPEEYSYFDFSKITDAYRIMEKDYKAAQKLIESGAVALRDFQIGYVSQIHAEGMVVEAEAECKLTPSRGSVGILFDHAQIHKMLCFVGGCKVNFDNRWGVYSRPQKLCPHAIALLLLAQERIEREHLGDATDLEARRLLKAFQSERRANVAEENQALTERVRLEPRLEWSLSMLQLSVRCGTSKLYVVKNFPELVEAVEKRGTLPQGKSSMLDFALCEFDRDSLELYQFIRRVIREEEARDRNSQTGSRYAAGGDEIVNRIGLYGGRLDQFFALYCGRAIPFSDKFHAAKKDMVLKLEEGAVRLKITVDAEEDAGGIFHGVRVTGRMPEILYGLEHTYLYREDKLIKITGECERGLRPLMELAEYTGRLDMVIGRRNLSEFYYRVLPRLSEFADVSIEKKQEIERYLPPEAVFVFYLDAEDGNVICTAKVVYGEEEFDLIDWRIADLPKAAVRDVQEEIGTLEVVEALFPERDWANKSFHCGQDADAVYHFLNTGLSQLMELGMVETTDRFRRLKIRDHAKVTVGVSVHSDIMDLEVLSEDLTQEELLDILFHYKRKKKYYRLRNGDFLDLENESLMELAGMMEALRISPKDFVKGKMHLPLYRALYLDKMLEQNEDIYAERDKNFKKLVKEFKTVKDSDYELPAELKDTMRNYQKYGFRWLCTLRENHFGGILADDMGLGKTLQVISVLLSDKESGGGGTALVVCPASLIYNWREEFLRFAPELTVAVLAGKKEERMALLGGYENWDVLVTSYDLLKRDIDVYEGKHFSYQIIDEAQYIKNQTTAAAKAVKLVDSRVRYALTGTPIENRLSELWSIFDFLMPGFLYSYESFRRDFEAPITKSKDEQATVQLRRMVSPFILRRLKKDVLKDLPEKLEEVQYAHMEEAQRQVYDGQVVRMRQMLEKETDENYRKNKLQVLAELTRLRQICCDPSLLFEDYTGESAKRLACLELIESAMEGGHKMLVFSQFTTMLELLEQDLKQKGIAFYKITGVTSKEERIHLVKAFNGDETPVFLISLKAGGTGLNLTGADIVIHYDPWWNQAVQNQATDRAHRIGQEKVVSVYRLIVKDSIEEKILKMQEGKANLADEILSGEMGGLAALSREELMELLAV